MQLILGEPVDMEARVPTWMHEETVRVVRCDIAHVVAQHPAHARQESVPRFSGRTGIYKTLSEMPASIQTCWGKRRQVDWHIGWGPARLDDLAKLPEREGSRIGAQILGDSSRP